VLKAACEGRLVPQDLNDEPADALLRRILDERRAQSEAEQIAKMQVQGRMILDDGWRTKYQEPHGPDTTGLAELPTGWCWATLGQLSVFVTSGSRGWAEYYSNIGPLFIRAQDIKTDKLELMDIAHVALPSSTEGMRTRVKEGDLLITITGANVTKTAHIKQDLGEAYVSQHVSLVRFADPVIGPYTHVWIISPANGRRILERDAYGLGKPGLSLNNLRELVIGLPPLAPALRPS
jgi:type I restriction enzyme S subunit